MQWSTAVLLYDLDLNATDMLRYMRVGCTMCWGQERWHSFWCLHTHCPGQTAPGERCETITFHFTHSREDLHWSQSKDNMWALLSLICDHHDQTCSVCARLSYARLSQAELDTTALLFAVSQSISVFVCISCSLLSLSSSLRYAGPAT